MDVYAVEQRAGDAVAIGLDLFGRATAFAFGVAIVAARARIHGGDDHALGGEGHGTGRAGDGDASVFERLAQYLQRAAFKLRQFVEEEDAVVGDADFAGGGIGAAAEQAGIGDGVMRRTKGARGDEGVFRVEQEAANAVDLGGLNGFIEGHRRDDGGDALGQHRFAGAGRADHEEVVAAGDGDFDGAFGTGLTLDFGEIDVVFLMLGEELGDVFAHRLEELLAGEEFEGFP